MIQMQQNQAAASWRKAEKNFKVIPVAETTATLLFKWTKTTLILKYIEGQFLDKLEYNASEQLCQEFWQNFLFYFFCVIQGK